MGEVREARQPCMYTSERGATASPRCRREGRHMELGAPEQLKQQDLVDLPLSSPALGSCCSSR